MGPRIATPIALLCSHDGVSVLAAGVVAGEDDGCAGACGGGACGVAILELYVCYGLGYLRGIDDRIETKRHFARG